MAEVNRHKIEDIINHLSSQGENLTLLLRAYKSNIVDGVNDCLTDIRQSNVGWDDDVATAFYERVDSLKTGVVQKLNDSIQTGGTVDKLEELIELLEDECYRYIKGFKDYDRPEDLSATTNDPFDGVFDDQEQVISDILDKIAALRFDSNPDDFTIEINPIQIEKQTVTVTQGDKVKVKVDDEEKVMYYLGTDEQGRSYFSETMDDDAPAFVSIWPGQMHTEDSFIDNITDTTTDPLLRYGYNNYKLLFQAYNDTGSLTVGKVLSKLPSGNYSNWQYVGGNNGFNESIVFESTYYAPEIVEKGNGSYDASSAFHVVSIGDKKQVSYSDFKNGNVSLYQEDFPDIVLQPGEKIKASYGTWPFNTNCTIGSDTESVLLHFDLDEYRYYVVNLETGGYYTADGNSDPNYRSIDLDKLHEVAGVANSGTFETEGGGGAWHSF